MPRFAYDGACRFFRFFFSFSRPTAALLENHSVELNPHVETLPLEQPEIIAAI